MVKTILMPGVSALNIARPFVHHWVFNCDQPVSLVVDNGGPLTSLFFQELCKLMNIHNMNTTIYHRQANCNFELFNRTILIEPRNDRTLLFISETGTSIPTRWRMHTNVHPIHHCRWPYLTCNYRSHPAVPMNSKRSGQKELEKFKRNEGSSWKLQYERLVSDWR